MRQPNPASRPTDVDGTPLTHPDEGTAGRKMIDPLARCLQLRAAPEMEEGLERGRQFS